MKKSLKIIAGVLATGVGIWLVVKCASDVLIFLKGIIGIAAAIIGLIILAIGISEIKD